MGKRLSQLNEVEQVSSTDYLLVDGEGYLESKKILLKNINIKNFNTKDLDKDLEGKQELLIDGKNIKKINGQSILGEGEIEIQGGEVDQIFNPQSQNAQSGKAVAGALEGVGKVYVGSGDMPDGYDLQIDPQGEVFSIDQHFNPNSYNPQSGIATAEALSGIKKKTTPHTKINLKELDISPIEHELKIKCCNLYDGTALSGIEILAYNQLPVGDLVSGGLTLSGGIYTSDYLVTTAYIEVIPKKVIFIDWEKSVRWVCLYDDKQNFIKQITTKELQETNSIFSVTNDTAYIRVTFDKDDNYFIAQGEKYVSNDSGIVHGIISTKYTTIESLGSNIGVQVEYITIVSERLENAIAENSERFDTVFNLLNAVQKMDIDVDRPTESTITVEPETIYMCDSGSNSNLISFTQDSDDNKHTGRIVLMVVGKEYAHQNKYTLAYVVTLTNGTLTPKYGNWSFFARRKDNGYNTKITLPNGSSIVKIKNATNWH